MDHIAHKVEQEVPITVFFDEGTTQEQIDAIGEQIRRRPEVQEIVFTSADDAWNEFKDQYFQGLRQQRDSGRQPACKLCQLCCLYESD